MTAKVCLITIEVGREQHVVLYALREVEVREKATKTSVTDVRAVFYVTQSPGRVYVEARGAKSAFDLLRYARYVKIWREWIIIPAHERSALLSPVRGAESFRENGWVRVRYGLHRHDLAQIGSVSENGETCQVLVVPRVAPPQQEIRRRPAKRTRKQKDRPLSQLFPISRARVWYGNDKVIEKDHFFRFDKKSFTFEGLRVLEVPYRGLRECKPRLDEISEFVKAAVESIQNARQTEATNDKQFSFEMVVTDDDIFHRGGIDISRLTFDTLLKAGDEVEVCRGPVTGKRGRVKEVTKNDTVHIYFSATDDNEVEDTRTEMEIAILDVRAIFTPGQSVEIKYGLFAGRVGLVESIDNWNIGVREALTHNEVREVITQRVVLTQNNLDDSTSAVRGKIIK